MQQPPFLAKNQTPGGELRGHRGGGEGGGAGGPGPLSALKISRMIKLSSPFVVICCSYNMPFITRI